MSFKEGFNTTIGVICAIVLILVLYFYGLDFLSWAKDLVVSGWSLSVEIVKTYPIQSSFIGAVIFTFIIFERIRGGYDE